MNSDESQDADRALRERIVSLMKANEQARRKAVPEDERKKLKAAASRLDQMLKYAVDAETQTLSNAASRLDQMLSDIRKGKDITGRIRRRKTTE